jgi:hypothetical protein
MSQKYIVPQGMKPGSAMLKKIDAFVERFEPREVKIGSELILHFDEKSGAHYLSCHIDGSTLAASCDLEASLYADDEDYVYKLNRDITEDQAAYRVMEEDACKGRSFEDMVTEYDTSYRGDRPLKVYGGQHREDLDTR